MGVLDVDPLLAAVGFADLILGRDHAEDLAEALDLDFLDWPDPRHDEIRE
jgi:hypothetical protein